MAGGGMAGGGMAGGYAQMFGYIMGGGGADGVGGKGQGGWPTGREGGACCHWEGGGSRCGGLL